MDLEKIKPGDVILTWGRKKFLGSVPIRIANFFKRGYHERGWTHAALYIGNDTVIEALPEGVVRHPLSESYLNGDFNLLILRRKNTNPESLFKAIAFCIAQAENTNSYDFRALIYFLLYNFIPLSLHFILDNNFMDSLFNVKNAYFCSELISEGFLQADIYCFEEKPYKIMPVDFHNDLWFDIVDKITTPIQYPAWNRIKTGLFRTFYFLSSLIFPLFLLGIFILPLLILTFFFVYVPHLFRSAKSNSSG